MIHCHAAQTSDVSWMEEPATESLSWTDVAAASSVPVAVGTWRRSTLLLLRFIEIKFVLSFDKSLYQIVP